MNYKLFEIIIIKICDNWKFFENATKHEFETSEYINMVHQVFMINIIYYIVM
jgi:hypothetical protein